MGTFLRILLVLGALVVAFFVRQYLSVRRGIRARDKALYQQLVPLAVALEDGAAVDESEIARLAAVAELRGPLYRLLASHNRQSLFPERFVNREAEAIGVLTHWMLHPHELQAAPETIEPVATLTRSVGGRQGEFRVFRYRMPSGHWAGREWLLGLAGPFFDGEEPYHSIAGGFSRVSDVHGKVAPDALVDWYAALVEPQVLRSA
jgi:hypothetical protein